MWRHLSFEGLSAVSAPLYVWGVSSSVSLVGRKKLVTEVQKMKFLFPSSPVHWCRGKWCLARCAQQLRVWVCRQNCQEIKTHRKELGLFGEMTDFWSLAGNVHHKPRIFCHSRKLLKTTGGFQRTQELTWRGYTDQRWNNGTSKGI